MNRTLIIAILAVVLGGGYYFYTSGNTVSNTVDGAMETATDAVEESVQSVTETATETVTDTGSESMDGALFSAEGFDAAKIGALIDASSLDENQKSGFKTALQGAMDDPALLTSILGQVKQALGI
ncbi:hypothetical protein [Profundibacter sp.]